MRRTGIMSKSRRVNEDRPLDDADTDTGPCPGAYLQGPGGASIRAPAPLSLVGAASSDYRNPDDERRPPNQRESDGLVEAEPVVSILVDATPIPIEAMEIESTEEPNWQPQRWLTRRTVAILAITTAAIVTAAVVVQVVLGAPKPPGILERFNATLSPHTIKRLQEKFSPQRRAYEWATQSDQLPVQDEPNDVERRLVRMKQRFALATLFYSIKGLDRWVNSTLSECQWGEATGSNVTCNAESRLVAVDVWSAGKGGALPPEVGLLTDLTSLGLGANGLLSPIPTEVGLLSALTSISLGSNYLTSSIPTELGQLSALTVLDLSRNDLTSIPSELGLLSGLLDLRLNENSLSTSIPSELGLLSALAHLDLSYGSLFSSIPTELGLLSALTSLGFTANLLTSSIPTELGQLGNLNTLWLYNNHLTGTFPSALCYVGATGRVSIDCPAISCTCCGC